jgi:hypothetical protein
MPRERWITIGEVQWPWFVFERCSGTPGGYLMVWRGDVDPVFQPCEFRRAEHLCWAIERRLRLAKLQWVAMACAVPRGTTFSATVRVLVSRIGHRDTEAGNE